MDIGKKTKKLNPVENANPLSIATFLYMFPIFRRAFKEELTEDDLFEPLLEHKSSNIGGKLEQLWIEEYKKHKKYALHIALIKLFGWRFMLLGMIKLLNEIMFIVMMPFAIGKLVSYFERDQTRISLNEAYIYAGILIGSIFLNSFLSHPAIMGIQHISMKLRVACSSLIYRKLLRLSRASLGNTTVGQLVNLLSNDVSKFDQGFILAHFMWIGPIQVAVGTYLLYQEIGTGALFGVGFLVSFVPLQMWLGKKISQVRLKTATRTDERVRLMNEVISGIQVIKMYCWEKPFAELISLARKTEMKAIKVHSYLLGIIYSFEVFVSRTAIFISILGYVFLGNHVTAEKIFAVTAIYNCMRPVITILFSISITSIAEVNISVIRLQQLMSYEERDYLPIREKLNKLPVIDKQALLLDKHTVNDGASNGCVKSELDYSSTTPLIRLENINAKWLEDGTDNTLKNITLAMESNQLLSVIGPVGSGKSSLLNLLLLELPYKSGKLKIFGNISYSSQEPWLFSGSVRQNILFGEKYDEERYLRIVDICALKSDFAQFPYGDKTLVGEKGKSLSGGQKARINLARCVYKKADIYLLDDPLSAVDTNVGKHLYDNCIRGFLSDKICVLVTHQLQYLKNSDKIIILKEGEIQVEGNYADLQTSGMDFAKLLEEFNNEETDEKEKKIRSRQNSEKENEVENEDQLMEKEKQDTGTIPMSIYWAYLKAGGGIFNIVLLTFSFIFCQFVANGGEYYVTYWVNLEQEHSERILQNLTNQNESLDRDEIIYVYTGLTLGTIFVAVVKSIYFMLFFTLASKNLHDFIFSKMIKATMKFYNANPSGRILNRFSKDLGIIDEYIPSVLIDVIEISFLLIGSIVLSAIVDPWLLLPAAGLMFFFYSLRMIYVKTSRSVKRIEAITKSPMFNHMTATLNGLSTIRAFSAEKMLIEEFDAIQDNHSSAWFLFIASSRCFGYWLDMICIAFIGIAVIILLTFSKNIHGGDLGLVITQLMGFIGTLQWGMRQWSELENQMTSVERVVEYTKLESEPNRNKKDLPIDWPQKGQIKFEDVKLRYIDSHPYVLKGLSFMVQPKEKIGVVGRTGAGKSSLISALFQLYSLEGSIIVDDIDTTEVPLDDVRSKISIIPQEPVLFSGTMRKNLDPFQEYSDDLLWNALEEVELKDVISELPSGLNSNVSEGGTNFSVGQRQLVCLARALVRSNKILILDEATANVDPHTDSLIQSTIKKKFASCSVLTIAHRLHTIMDSDKILVMDGGSIVEYDHPYNLLQKQGGFFRNLVETTGKTTAKNLEKIATENYLKKNNME